MSRPVGHLNHRSYGIDSAQRVRDMGDGDQPGSVVEELLKFIEQQLPVVVDRRNPKMGAAFFAQQLPGNDVRVMLHGGDHDFVAGLNVFSTVASGDKIDRVGRSARVDDLAAVGRPEESLHLPAGILVVVGRPLAQLMHAAVHIRAVLVIKLSNGVDHDSGRLRRGRVVEIDQWFAVDALVERGEITPQRGHIQPLDSVAFGGGHGRGGDRCHASSLVSTFEDSHRRRSPSRRSRRVFTWMRSRMSAAKA